MDVYLIPIGADRYELYCEPQADQGTDAVPDGWFAGIRRNLAHRIKMAEERQRTGAPPESKGWFGRLNDSMMAWVAERIAEQRLLWNLRGKTMVVAAHPEDMAFEQVLAVVRQGLRENYDRHWWWLIVDGIAFLATVILLGPIFLLIPGVANLPAFYFGFRVLGHWLSMRGAAQGLHRITWTSRPCPPLTELREMAALDAHARNARVADIAARLRLPHLASFVERIAFHRA